MEKKILYVGLCSLFLIAGIIIGKQTDNPIVQNIQSISTANPVRQSGFRYTNPLLECEVEQSIGEAEYRPSKNKVEELINQRRQRGDVSQVAVYYRDLNNGPWFGINERDNYSPASLLKLPVMIAYYKLAESNPSILGKKVVYEKRTEPVEQSFIIPKSLEYGKSYTVDELIQHMMGYSDNNALFLLEENIDGNLIDKITQDLGIETPSNETLGDFMSVKSYATLMRVLYNASYINREFSEKALQIMAGSDFNKGLVRGVPSQIEVANKFGERAFNGIKQLHDCGVIYYPHRPYLLCIMTRGYDYQTLSEVISQISEQIYADIDRRFGN